MGQPMAANLLRAGTSLVVWNRTPEKCEALRALGATVADTVDEVFERAGTVILMLFNRAVIGEVLQPGSARFAAMLRGGTIVNMSSIAPADSIALDRDIRGAGGHYIEAPVSGSRVPAENGQLIALVAGEEERVRAIRPLLAPMCREQIFCGPVGHGLLMKLAVNLYLSTTLAALAEAFHFAERQGVDVRAFEAAINSGQMASDLTRVKLPKLVARDFSLQASTSDARNSTRLIAEAARAAGVASPLLDVSGELYAESVVLGNGRRDMVSVVEAVEARSRALGGKASKG